MKIKILFLILFLLSFSLGSVAQQKKLSDDKIELISAKLCTNIKYSRSNEFKINDFRSIILRELSTIGSSKSQDKAVSDFLNRYSNKMVCVKNHLERNSRPLHLYKTAVLDGVLDLFDELMDDEVYQIDWNAYQIVNGKKETLIDYLDKVLNGKFKNDSDLELLRDDLINYGAKRGKDLK